MATGGYSSDEVYGATSEYAELGSDSYRSVDGGSTSTNESIVGSEEGFQFKCTRCEGKDRVSEAKHYCTICAEYYCNDCIKIHSEISVLRSHVILGEESKDRWGERRQIGGPAGADCEDHVGQTVSMFCEVHDAVCCPICVAMNHRYNDRRESKRRCLNTDHRQCEGMAYLPLISKGIFESDTLKTLRNGLNDIRVFVEEYKSKGNTMKSNLEESIEKTVKELQKHRDKIDALLDELQRKAEEIVHDIHRKNRELIESDDAICDDILNRVDEQQMQITNVYSIPEPEMFVRIRKVQRSQSNIRAIISKLNPTKVADQIKLNVAVDNDIVRFIENYPALAQFETYRSDVADTRSNLLLQAQTKDKPQAKSLAQEQLEKTVPKFSVEPDIQMRLDSDQPDCCVESMCQMEDGTIVIADSFNGKLKLLDQSYTIIDHVTLQSYPYDICCTVQNEIAVGLSQNAVQLVNVTSGKLILGSAIQKLHQCCGIAFGNGKLYISQYHGKKIFVYAYPSLRRLRTIYNKSVSKIQHMKMSKNNDVLFIADLENGIIALNVERVFQKVSAQILSLPDLCYIGGMCLDKSGQLIVTDKQVNTVARYVDAITTDTIVGQADGLDEPGPVLFDVKQSKLLVYNGSRGQTIKVYKIA